MKTPARPIMRYQFELSYRRVKEPIEQARRTLFRSAAGFGPTGTNGRKTGFRSTDKRTSTTASTDWGRYYQHVDRFTKRLQGVVIEHGDALELIDRYDGPETLFYIDPPYPMNVRNTHTVMDKMYKHELTIEEHRVLAGKVQSIQGYAIISGYAHSLYDDELFKGWPRHEYRTQSFRGSKRVECIWLNERAAEHTRQILLI